MELNRTAYQIGKKNNDRNMHMNAKRNLRAFQERALRATDTPSDTNYLLLVAVVILLVIIILAGLYTYRYATRQ